MLKAAPKNKGEILRGTKLVPREKDSPPTLSDLGLDKKTSQLAQQVAALKEKSIEVWVKAEKKDAELQNIIAEQKLRTQRVLGQLIKDGQKNGELRGKGNLPGVNHQERNIPEGNITPKTLEKRSPLLMMLLLS